MTSINLKTFKDKFEREVVKIMRDYKVPGMSILIMKNGKSLYERAFGSRDLLGGKPAKIDTLYGIASITKSITCMVILQLHEAKKLNIHDPISKYIPVDLGFEDQPITIHHLMCHASGIPSLNDYVFSQMNQGLYKSNVPNIPMGNWDDFYFHVNDAKSEILSPPNKKYYYYNGGFTLLSQIVAKVSGMTYEEYIEENILKPLDMKRSTFFREVLEKDQNASAGYNYELIEENKFKRSPKPHLSGPFVAGAGAFNSSVQELSNYLQCHLNNGEYNGKKLLHEDLVKEMRKPHNTNLKKRQFLLGGSKEYYGYGWRIVENYYGYTLITHYGNSGVSGGNVGFIPELNLSFAQLYNVTFLPAHLMHMAFVLLMGKDPKGEIAFYKRDRHYKNLSGTYHAYKKVLTVEIKEKDGLLYLEDDNWPDKYVYPLIPKNTDLEVMDFYIILPYGTMDIPFTKHSDGKITFDYERYLLHKKQTN